MKRLRFPRGMAGRIGLAVLITAGVAVAVVAVGVTLVSGATFAQLMMQHGTTAAEAHAMFDQSVSVVLVAAIVLAIIVAVAMALLMAAALARPLRGLGQAARRIARGDYAARVPRDGPEEIASLADSFNQMAAALQEQERMRREFIANASHELRTPLTNLTGYLEAMRDGIVPVDREAFDSLLEETERMVRLSRSLDQLAESDLLGARPLIAVDLAPAIRTAVGLAMPNIERAGLAVAISVPERLPAHADPDGLAQVLGNLLQNAVRYTPSGGRIEVGAERRRDDILVSVSNTGEGIPPEDLPHVFERFYRVDKSRDQAHGGAGIGLSIVRQIVESAGGAVGAESERGLTRFWFSVLN
jgi:two-component system, OmpR family, sensor histidine kinase BaeS